MGLKSRHASERGFKGSVWNAPGKFQQTQTLLFLRGMSQNAVNTDFTDIYGCLVIKQ